MESRSVENVDWQKFLQTGQNFTKAPTYGLEGVGWADVNQDMNKW